MMNSITAAVIFACISAIIYHFDLHDELYYRTVKYLDFEEKSCFELASINYTEIDGNFDEVSKQLLDAFAKVGFAILTDVPDFNPVELRHWIKWFFDLNRKEKMQVAKNAFNAQSENFHRGYTPIIPGGSSYKELFEIGMFERAVVTRKPASSLDIRNVTLAEGGRYFMRNILQEKCVWPITNDAESDEKFREVMRRNYRLYSTISEKLFQLLVHAFGLKRTKFDYMFEKKLSTLRSIHYPTRLNDPTSIPAEGFDEEEAVVTPPHFDSSILTILGTFNYSGLQVKPKGFSRWIDVPVDGNKIIINSGSLLVHLTEGKVVATNHRVLDIGADRYSIAMFHGFNFDADVSTTFFGNPNPAVGKFKKYGTWMTNRTSQFSESASVDFGVPD